MNQIEWYAYRLSLKRDATPNVVLNTLYKYHQLQSSFSVNICIGKRPSSDVEPERYDSLFCGTSS
jgi:DNA gyrase/topoisomerase IV subunit A